jgi:hypothetical protein
MPGANRNSALRFAGPWILAVLFSFSASAQTRGGAFAVRSAPTGSGSVHTATPRGRALPPGRTGTHAVRRGSTPPSGRDVRMLSDEARADNSVTFGGENGVPGLGFDYPHLAAISGGIDNNRFGERGHHGDRNQGAFVPFFFGGLPYYDSVDNGEVSYEQSQPQQETPQQPQVIVLQPIVQQVPAPSATQPASATVVAAPAATIEPPAKDVSGYVLVLGNGRVVFASAYSVAGTQLRYVTPEGIRGTFPVADLDSSATHSMNEARGINLQL